ncbi:MAG: tRNA pseudouridine synthase A [Candidatus Kariarchaeaceae archaeon]|jgi:tRNA pseudouridine38-40 synthase
MKNYAFRVYYDGTQYSGFQRQPNGQSIENHLEFAFIRCKYISSFRKNSYRASSRTDAGVSAVANVFSMKLPKEPNLNFINSRLPKNKSILVWGYAEVPNDFDSRATVQKHYIYYLSPTKSQKIANMDRLNHFLGTHNFSNFIIKGGAGASNPYTRIDEIITEKVGSDTFISLKGDKFGREQIRQMIGFLCDKRYNEISPALLLQESLDRKYNIASVSPSHLALLEVTFQERIKWIVQEIEEDVIRRELKISSINTKGGFQAFLIAKLMDT